MDHRPNLGTSIPPTPQSQDSHLAPQCPGTQWHSLTSTNPTETTRSAATAFHTICREGGGMAM